MSLSLQRFLSIQAPVPQTGGLTEGAITARHLGSVFLFPERFMQNCTHSARGPRLAAESSTCKLCCDTHPEAQWTGCESSPAIWESTLEIRLKPDFQNLPSPAGHRVKARYELRSYGEKL